MDGQHRHPVNSPDTLVVLVPSALHNFRSVVVFEPGFGRIDKFFGLDFELLERVTVQLSFCLRKGFRPFALEVFVIGAFELLGEVSDRLHAQIDRQLRNTKLFSKDIYGGGSHRPGKLGETLALELVQILHELRGESLLPVCLDPGKKPRRGGVGKDGLNLRDVEHAHSLQVRSPVCTRDLFQATHILANPGDHVFDVVFP